MSNFGISVSTLIETGNKVVSAPFAAAALTVTLGKTNKQDLDISTYSFTITLPVDDVDFAEFNSTAYALIQFPTYYPAQIGEGVQCWISKTAADDPVSTLCIVDRDWHVKVWGSEGVTPDTDAPFIISISGVSVANPATAGSFYVSLYPENNFD